MTNERADLIGIIKSYEDFRGKRVFDYSFSGNDEMTIYTSLSVNEKWDGFRKTKKFLERYNKKNCCEIKFKELDLNVGRVGEPEHMVPVFFLEGLPHEEKSIKTACSRLSKANEKLYKKFN